MCDESDIQSDTGGYFLHSVNRYFLQKWFIDSNWVDQGNKLISEWFNWVNLTADFYFKINIDQVLILDTEFLI
jgi:hypothetical protein